jgi:hypothetical protein
MKVKSWLAMMKVYICVEKSGVRFMTRSQYHKTTAQVWSHDMGVHFMVRSRYYEQVWTEISMPLNVRCFRRPSIAHCCPTLSSRGYIFQDAAMPQSTMQDWLSHTKIRNRIPSLIWSAQSPDINIIKNLWFLIKVSNV